MDNYGTHKHEKVRRFLDRHRRFKVHYIPTSSSWLNLVERWFAELSGKAVRRGSFASVPDLIEAIFDFIAQWKKSRGHSSGQPKRRTSWQRLKGVVSGWRKSLQDAQNRKEG